MHSSLHGSYKGDNAIVSLNWQKVVFKASKHDHNSLFKTLEWLAVWLGLNPRPLAQKSDAPYKLADSNTFDFFITCGENLAATGWDLRSSSESLSISLSEAENKNNQKDETKWQWAS